MSTHKYLYNFSRLHHKIPVEKEQLVTHTIIRGAQRRTVQPRDTYIYYYCTVLFLTFLLLHQVGLPTFLLPTLVVTCMGIITVISILRRRMGR